MSSAMEASLYECTASTFEMIASLEAQRELSEHQWKTRVAAAASVSFWGPMTGRVAIRVCDHILPAIAMNALGYMEPPSEEMQLDALGEVANIICGSMLRTLSPETSFGQGTPQVASYNGGSDDTEPACASVTVGLQEGRAEVLLYLQEASS
jgi:CheY-specific phosphatase CheX